MKNKENFSWRKRLKAFSYARRGIGNLIRYEHNFRIHVVAAILALILCFLLSVSAIEWCIILLCIGGVFCAEALNSALEALADRITTEYDPAIKRSKDVAAAAVTFMAISALICGLIIFLPKIFT